MKFSIAMCTYNGASFIQEQLDSIAAQTRLPDELVICDDQSNDKTRELIKSFASQATFPVRLHTNEVTLGSTKNFDKAIRLCAGEIIALSDQDDVWHPEKLKSIETKFLSEPDTGLVFTDAEVVDELLHPLGYSLWESIKFGRAEQQLIKEGKAFDVLLGHTIVTGATMAFRALFKKLVLPIPTNISSIHDGWIALMIAATADLSFISDNCIKYRQHSAQQSGVAPPFKNIVSESLIRIQHHENKRHLDIIRRLECVLGRLLLNKNTFPCIEAIMKLEGKLAHLQARASLPSQRLSRLPIIFRELTSLRYHNYSSGLQSAAKDLLL